MIERPAQEYLCIGCPLGCRLEVEDRPGGVLEVRGFTCKKGKEYGEQEHRDPRRVVTTTVRLRDGGQARLPVKSSIAVPKAMVGDVCAALRGVEVAAPVAMGAVIVSNILSTGADIVATRDMAEDGAEENA